MALGAKLSLNLKRLSLTNARLEMLTRTETDLHAQESAMRKRHSFATTIVGKSSLLREGIAKILRSANFRILASVSSADDLPGKVEADDPLFLIVHTGDDFDFVAGQIEFFRDSYPDGRIAIVADRYRPDQLISAFRVGANGCFVDVMTCDVFIRSLELVMMGETVLPPARRHSFRLERS